MPSTTGVTRPAPVVRQTAAATNYVPATTGVSSTIVTPSRVVAQNPATTYAPTTVSGMPTIPVQKDYNGAPVIERKLIFRDP